MIDQDELSKRLNVTRRRVRQLVNNGQVPWVRSIGRRGRVLFDWAAVKAARSVRRSEMTQRRRQQRRLKQQEGQRGN